MFSEGRAHLIDAFPLAVAHGGSNASFAQEKNQRWNDLILPAGISISNQFRGTTLDVPGISIHAIGHTKKT